MIRPLAVLLGVPLLLAALFAVPLTLWRGNYQLLCAGVALALTVPPGLLTLWAAEWFAKTSPFGRILASFVGIAVRLFVGFVGGAVVFLAAGSTFRAEPFSYWGWLLGAYLTTLVLETALIARPLMAVGKPGKTSCAVADSTPT